MFGGGGGSAPQAPAPQGPAPQMPTGPIQGGQWTPNYNYPSLAAMMEAGFTKEGPLPYNWTWGPPPGKLPPGTKIEGPTAPSSAFMSTAAPEAGMGLTRRRPRETLLGGPLGPGPAVDITEKVR